MAKKGIVGKQGCVRTFYLSNCQTDLCDNYYLGELGSDFRDFYLINADDFHRTMTLIFRALAIPRPVISYS
jgi:hypothetical protein